MPRSLLGLALFLVAFALAGRAGAQSAPYPRVGREVRESLRIALHFLERNPERAARLLPEGFTTDDLDTEIRIRVGPPAGEQTDVMLNTHRQTLVTFGRSLQALDDRENMARLYALVYARLPPEYRTDLPSPFEVSRQSRKQVQRAWNRLVETVDTNWTRILLTVDPGSLLQFPVNPIGDCTLEAGYGTAGPDSEVSSRCTLSMYNPAGLFTNIDFPLKERITCIKDQGKRGTCAAFATVATVETLGMVAGDLPHNLSEQHAYYRGEVDGDILVSTGAMQDYGLYVDAMHYVYESRGYGFFPESEWGYNRSPDIGSAELDPLDLVIRYPDSCSLDYTGTCGDTTWQTGVSGTVPGAPIPDPAPPMSGSVYGIGSSSVLPVATGIVTEGTLQTAVLLLSGEVPVILGFTVTDAFKSTADGYVRLAANDPVAGGHFVEAVGFVPNSALPIGVPAADEEGYFIIKNSWGRTKGDCGFYYLDYAWVKSQMYFATVLAL